MELYQAFTFQKVIIKKHQFPFTASYRKPPQQKKLLFYERKGKARNFQNVNMAVFPLLLNSCAFFFFFNILPQTKNPKGQTQNNSGETDRCKYLLFCSRSYHFSFYNLYKTWYYGSVLLTTRT